MTPLKATFTFGILAGLLLGTVAAFNYSIDAMCFFHCPTVTLNRFSLNTYYQTVQKIVAHPDAEEIIVGSSRGQTTPTKYLDQYFGLKTLNLSVEGAELVTKATMIHMALEKAPIKRIIWMADYFELIPSGLNLKLINCPAIMSQVPAQFKTLIKKDGTSLVESLLDHNTFEASIAYLSKDHTPSQDWGSGSGLNPEECANPNYAGVVSEKALPKEIDLIYENYAHEILVPPQSEVAEELFKKELRELTAKGIEVDIVLTPYHPVFMQRLQTEHPEIYKRHEEWVRRVEALAGPHLQVINGWKGIPGANSSPRSWNDGVHYSCHSVIALINEIKR
jgi:hypothetical protein